MFIRLAALHIFLFLIQNAFKHRQSEHSQKSISRISFSKDILSKTKQK